MATNFDVQVDGGASTATDATIIGLINQDYKTAELASANTFTAINYFSNDIVLSSANSVGSLNDFTDLVLMGGI